MASATTEMMMTTILPAQSISLSDALFLNIGLYTSDENADDEARSCESAVLMDAARIAERSIPATSAGNTPLTSLMNTCELSVSPPPRYLRPDHTNYGCHNEDDSRPASTDYSGLLHLLL